MRRIKLTVAYDGTDYCGWQKQPELPTIEGELNKALTKLNATPIEVIGASRTDSGVHALGNVAVFDTDSTIPADRYSYAINTLLPEAIVVVKSEQVADDFHPRHCETEKTYEYRYDNQEFPNPLKSRFQWHIRGKMNLEAMQQAADYLVGEHDFKAFCSIHTQAESTVRTIYRIEVLTEDESTVVLRVTGNGFLYNMVRIIAGTLMQVGLGHKTPQDVRNALDSCERETAGPTAPPQGLRLVGINYK